MVLRLAWRKKGHKGRNAWGRRSQCVVCLQPCAGPEPLFRGLHQVGVHEVVLYIRNDFVVVSPCLNESSGRTTRPARTFPGAPEDAVGHAAGSPFEPLHHVRQRGSVRKTACTWFGMITQSVEGVEAARILPVAQSVFDYSEGTFARSVQDSSRSANGIRPVFCAVRISGLLGGADPARRQVMKIIEFSGIQCGSFLR